MGNDHGDDGGDLAVYSNLRARSENYLRKRGLGGSVEDLAQRGPSILRSAVGLALDKRFESKHGDAPGLDTKRQELELVHVSKTMASRYPIEFRCLELIERGSDDVRR